MKPMQIHPLSALVGAAVLALVAVSMAQQQVPPALPSGSPTLYGASPNPIPPTRMVQLDTSPFIVPPGRILVLTALGRNGWTKGVTSVSSNGVAHAAVNISLSKDEPGSMVALPAGLAFPTGTTVVVNDSTGANSARAWGWLADA